MGSSYHDCLTWQYECLFDNPTAESLPCTYNYWKGNYLAMCKEFNEINWDLLLSNDTIDINWNLFKEKVTSDVDKYVPKVAKKIPSN